MKRPLTKAQIQRGMQNPVHGLIEDMLESYQVAALSRFYGVPPEQIERDWREQVIPLQRRFGFEFTVGDNGELLLRRRP